MDSATQQNAALVEQAAAATESLQDQAQGLARAVQVFRLAGAAAHHAPERRERAMRPENAGRRPQTRQPAGGRVRMAGGDD